MRCPAITGQHLPALRGAYSAGDVPRQRQESLIANLTEEVEVLETLREIESSSGITDDQALQIAQIKALIAIARAINPPTARRTR